MATAPETPIEEEPTTATEAAEPEMSEMTYSFEQGGVEPSTEFTDDAEVDDGTVDGAAAPTPA